MNRVWLLVMVCTFTRLLVGCSEKPQKVTTTEAGYCFLDGQLSCLSRKEKSIAILHLDKPIEIETRLPIKLEIDHTLTIASVSAQLTGENMYMGTMPIALSASSDGNWRGDLIIVACSRPDMIWRIQADVELENGETHSFFWLFEARR